MKIKMINRTIEIKKKRRREEKGGEGEEDNTYIDQQVIQ
jgi:hypothetical protein